MKAERKRIAEEIIKREQKVEETERDGGAENARLDRGSREKVRNRLSKQLGQQG